PTMAGEHERFGYGHSEILYEDVQVPEENIIGRVGQGFQIAQMRLGPGRIHHCMRWLGQARRAFDMLCERALQREAFGGPLALEEMYRHARAARLYDGPDEVHRQSVARYILRDYRAPEGWLPREHVPTRREAARQKFAQLLEDASANL